MTSLYPKLAVGGIKKNRRIYIPYLLACSGMIMMYYIVSFLTVSDFVAEMRGGDVLGIMLTFGCGIMILFSAIFLYYTNSFIIRRRKTEFGLYNILGMDKRNIARILVWETLITYAFSIVCGIGCGILFSKLAELLLTKMLGGAASYKFGVEMISIIHALVYYAVIFFSIMLNGLRQIHLSNPIELLRSENSGEKPPKANWFTAFIGVIILAAAYFIAVTIKNPVSALSLFFVAVGMVIIATNILFKSGSVAMCRLLQKNKKYYYKTNRFVSVSQMAYRMKRNGEGLALICILSTMVLVTVSSTVCLYAGSESILRSRYPRNFVVDTYTDEENMVGIVRKAVSDTLSEYGEAPCNILNYTFLDFSGGFKENTVILDPDKRNELFGINPDIRQIFIITIDDYNRLMNKNVILGDGEALIYITKENYNYDTVTVDGYGTFRIVSAAEDFIPNGVEAVQMAPSVYLFVKDGSVINELYDIQRSVYGDDSSYIHDYYCFDLSCDDDKQIAVSNSIINKVKLIKEENPDIWEGVGVDSAASDKAEFFALYGGLFFLGIIFGTVFICAAVLIMYYKQISEGFEDRSKFTILRKVGMTKEEIKRSINSQVLTVFFLPLAAAGLHMAFAFPMVSKLLMLFGLNDTLFLALVTLSCFGAFAVLYIAVYLLTSRSYYGIVSADKD